MKKCLVFCVYVVLLFGMTRMANSSPFFYVNPGLDPSLDQTWQTAVGNSFVEFDLNNFSRGFSVEQLTAPSLSIDVGLFNVITSATADTAEIFWGLYTGNTGMGYWDGSPGGQYGTVSGGALLNRNSSSLYSDITFTFSNPVSGFGAWLFDNSSNHENSILMTVVEAGGSTFVSDVLDIGNGKAHSVEGWLAVTSDVGITGLSYRVLDECCEPDNICAFEMDHIQVASTMPVPEPSTFTLLFLVIIGLFGIHHKKPVNK